jgi:hypothetical protein
MKRRKKEKKFEKHLKSNKNETFCNVKQALDVFFDTLD